MRRNSPGEANGSGPIVRMNKGEDPMESYVPSRQVAQ